MDCGTTLSEMMQRAGHLVYDCYIMDANLGRPNSPNISAAVEVCAFIRGRGEDYLTKFIALTANPDALELARAEGIPVQDKMEFRLLDFLKLEERVEAEFR